MTPAGPLRGRRRRQEATISDSTRVEHDLLGDLAVPADVYYGVHTVRALENFAISGTRIGDHPELVRPDLDVSDGWDQPARARAAGFPTPLRHAE